MIPWDKTSTKEKTKQNDKITVAILQSQCCSMKIVNVLINLHTNNVNILHVYFIWQHTEIHRHVYIYKHKYKMNLIFQCVRQAMHISLFHMSWQIKERSLLVFCIESLCFIQRLNNLEIIFRIQDTSLSVLRSIHLEKRLPYKKWKYAYNTIVTNFQNGSLRNQHRSGNNITNMGITVFMCCITSSSLLQLH